MILAVAIADVTLILRAPNVELKRSLTGLLVGVSISIIVIFLDLSLGGLVHLPSANPLNESNIWTLLISILSPFVIGFSFLSFIQFLLRRGVVSFVILFTTASSIISSYYLISLSQLHVFSSLGIIGFAFGSIIFLLFFPTFISLISNEPYDLDWMNPDKIAIDIGGNIGGNLMIGDSNLVIKKPNTSTNDNTDEVYIDLKKFLNEIDKRFFKASIAHPKLISKRFDSPFIVQLYFEELANNVKAKIKEIAGESYTERIYDTELKFGQVIKIKLFSSDITFSEPIVKRLDSSLNSMTFLGKPTDACQSGNHKIILSILNGETGIEYQSEIFSVKVVDFAFDHISRPLLSKISTVVLGIGSLAMFILTFLEQIDKTIGLTSGTAAGVLAVAVYASFYDLYQRVRSNIP